MITRRRMEFIATSKLNICIGIFAFLTFVLYPAYTIAGSVMPTLRVEDVAEAPVDLAGKQVAVRGFVRFGDDTKNLWADERTYLAALNGTGNLQELSSHKCLSLYTSKKFSSRLRHFDKRLVTIYGKVYRYKYVPGDINLGYCNDLGIIVTGIK